MITKVIQIGNSKGIRIPNSILKQLDIDTQLEMTVTDNAIYLEPIHKSRQGWDKAFKQMHINNDDELIINDSIDLEAWEW